MGTSNNSWIPAFAGMTDGWVHGAKRIRLYMPVIPAKAGIQIRVF